MKYKIYLIAISTFLSLMVSCDDMYHIHQKYLDEGETVYLGRPDSVTAYAGYKRVQLEWKLNSDPKVDECCIYWNNRQDSMSVVPSGTNTKMKQIIPLPEGKYNLEIINKSKKGYRSLSNIVSVESYGENYQKTLYNRAVSTQVAHPTNVVLTWSLEEGCVGTTMEYVNRNGETKTVFIDKEQTSLTLTDFVAGAPFTCSSLYVPETGAIDTIPTREATYSFVSFYSLSKEDWEANYRPSQVDINRSGWTTSASTEELVGEGAVSGRASAILDGNMSTFWHSQWQGGTPALPHRIDIDMQKEQTVTSIEVARRNNNRDTKKVVLSLSEDGQSWNEIGYMTFPNATAPNSKVIMFPTSLKGRYLRLMVTESNNSNNASLSEVFLTK